MKIVVYCEQPEDRNYRASIEALAEAGVEWVFLAASGAGRTVKTKTAESIVYFDAENFSCGKMAELGEKSGRPWGVLDRKGSTADPAAIFHAGGADYLGPALWKTGGILTEKRIALMEAAGERSAANVASSCAESADANGASAGRHPPFPGWDKLQNETCYPFVFVFAALGDQQDIRTRLGEKRLDKLRADFSMLMENWAEEHGGKLWIRDAPSNLFLFPAAEENGQTIPALVRLQLNRLLIGYEQLRIDSPVRFRFAVHAGEAPWRKPGSTGTVVSEHVNFIYHLGMKAVADGTLGVSDNAFPLIPRSFEDLFRDGPEFENRRVKHSRDFA